MKVNEFQRLEEHFNRAIELDSVAQAAYVDELATTDKSLAERLARMLASAADDTADPLRESIIRAVEKTDALPDRIGPFKVLRRLGRGGMGIVYLCRREHDDFEQLLAVKRLNAAADSEFARERLRVERRVLASLRHPQIAQLVDGGEDAEGIPYVAMEFIDGVAIDAYVRDHALTLRNRVRLFLDLCSAVQFAHQNAVIHRDLKADNVQVDQHGNLKLLDFGIAKLVHDADRKADAPATVASIMTPHYASPEQIRGEPVSQLSDIYSLGVLLHEILAGSRPYVLATRRPAEIERIVCEQDHAPPLSGTRGRHAELNSIVAKAMHKAAPRRYATAAQLAEDLQRWLDGLPVSAQPDSAAYRSWAFVRRHPVGVTSVAIIALLLLGFGSVMAWQAHELQLQRDAARHESVVANETTDFLIELFASTDPREGDPRERTAAELLQVAADRLPGEFTNDPLTRARLLHVIGLAFANIGEDQRGTALLTQALALRAEHAGPNSAETADTQNRLGNIHRRFGRLREAAPLLVAALNWRTNQGVVDHDLADSYNNVGLLQNDLGDYASAEATLKTAIEMHRTVGGDDTARAAAPLHNLALALQRQGRLDEALAVALEALQIKRDNDWNSSSLANTLAVLANVERERGALTAALAHSTESLALRERVFGRANPMIASGLATHARVMASLNRTPEAEALFIESLDLYAAGDRAQTLRVAQVQLSYGRFLLKSARVADARGVLEQAYAIAAEELPSTSPELDEFSAALAQAQTPSAPSTVLED